MFVLPFLTGCTANVVGKFNDYNEIFLGTIDLDLKGHGIIQVKTEPNNISCKGNGWLTYIPHSSTCKGQQGKAELICDDGRTFDGNWICEACTRINGEGKTNYNEKITFYIATNKKKIMKKEEEYRKDVAYKPSLSNQKIFNVKNLEDLF